MLFLLCTSAKTLPPTKRRPATSFLYLRGWGVIQAPSRHLIHSQESDRETLSHTVHLRAPFMASKGLSEQCTSGLSATNDAVILGSLSLSSRLLARRFRSFVLSCSEGSTPGSALSSFFELTRDAQPGIRGPAGNSCFHPQHGRCLTIRCERAGVGSELKIQHPSLASYSPCPRM